MYITRAAATVAVLVTAALAPLVTPAPTLAQAADTGTILFQDDFSGSAGSRPDPAKWEDYAACTYNGSAAFGNIKCGNNETLDGAGHLSIPATPTAGSAIRTGSKFGFVYGTMSAWLKSPTEVGYWPAFWSLNNNPNGVNVYPIGEADAAEIYTTWNKGYHAVGHVWAGSGKPGYHSPDNFCGAGADLTGRFNKYSATIEPGKVTFSFNDVPCAKAFVKDPAKQWGFGPDVTRPNWLILDLAVGGASGQQAAATKPAKLLVDRVEVRALPTGPSSSSPSPPSSSSSSPSSIVSGASYELTNSCGGKVAEVPAASVGVDGAIVRTAGDSNTSNQRWRVVAVPGGRHKLINLASGKTLRLQSTTNTIGVSFVQAADTGGWNSEFLLKDLGSNSWQLLVRTSGKAVQVTSNSGASGATLQQNHPSPGACGQRWRLTRV